MPKKSAKHLSGQGTDSPGATTWEDSVQGEARTDTPGSHGSESGGSKQWEPTGPNAPPGGKGHKD